MMHSLFFWNQLDITSVKSTYLLSLLKEWFALTLVTDVKEPSILGSLVERSLNNLVIILTNRPPLTNRTNGRNGLFIRKEPPLTNRTNGRNGLFLRIDPPLNNGCVWT